MRVTSLLLASCMALLVCSVKCCEDKHAMCHEWAARGECQANPSYMLPNCQISCNQCGGGTGEGGGNEASCQDQHESCPGWASSGECVNNPAYMFGHCQRSCDTCGGGVIRFLPCIRHTGDHHIHCRVHVGYT